MATRTVAALGGNWNSTSTWVEGVVPTSADDVVFNALSGNLTINVVASCLTLFCDTTLATVTFNQSLTVGGNISLSPVMTITGTGGLILGASCTLTSNGKTFNAQLVFPSTTQTITLADNWTNSGLIIFPNVTVTTTINGNTLNISGSLTHNNGNSITGTTIINFNGTGTFTGNASGFYIDNPVTINTSGTLTLTGNMLISGNLTYTAGTVNAGTSNLFLRSTINVNTNGINWYNIWTTAAATITLISNLTATNNVNLGTTASPTFNGSTFNIGGSLTLTNNITVSGTTNFVLNGTGTWSQTGATALLKNNLTFNTSGTITISGTVRYDTGTLTYIAGTVITTGSTLLCNAATTFDTNGITWNNLTFQGNTVTYTLLSNLTINGSFSNSNPHTFNGSQIICNGGIAVNQTINGTTTILYSGTGTWSGSGAISLAMTINTAGTLTCSGTISATNLTYIAGTVVTTGSTLSCSNTSAMYDTNGITWNNVILGAGTITLNSLFSATGTMTVGGANTVTFAGTAGFSVSSFICLTAGRIINFKAGNTYAATTLFQLRGTNSSRIQFKSDTASSYAFFNLQSGGTCDVQYVNATDIDSSGGRIITDVKGTLLRTINWAIYNPDLFSMFYHQ